MFRKLGLIGLIPLTVWAVEPAKQPVWPEFETSRPPPAASWWDTSDNQTIQDYRRMDWNSASVDQLRETLHHIEVRLARKKSETDWRLIRAWHEALLDWADRPDCAPTARDHFVTAATSQPRLFATDTYARLASRELERRLAVRWPNLGQAEPDAEPLWQAGCAAADRLAQPPPKVDNTGDPGHHPATVAKSLTDLEKTSYCHNGEAFHILITAGLKPDSRLSESDVSAWRWGIPCGTGAGEFEQMRRLARALALAEQNDTPSCAGIWAEVYGNYPEVFLAPLAKDPREHESRSRALYRRLAAREGIAPDAELLGRLIHLRRTGEMRLDIHGDTQVRNFTRGGDAWADALLRIHDGADTEYPWRKHDGNRFIRAVLKLMLNRPNNPEVRGVLMRFSDKFRFGQNYSIEYRTANCHGFGGADPYLNAAFVPDFPISTGMRSRIEKRLAAEKASE